MAETDECAHRACLRMADVTVIHSVTTSATGLTATEIGRGSTRASASCSVSGAVSSLAVLDILEGGGIRESGASEVWFARWSGGRVADGGGADRMSTCPIQRARGEIMLWGNDK